MKIGNRVTEKPTGAEIWLVTVNWRGGHDRRVITLENQFTTEAEAEAEAEVLRLAENEANYSDYGDPRVRKYSEVIP